MESLFIILHFSAFVNTFFEDFSKNFLRINDVCLSQPSLYIIQPYAIFVNTFFKDFLNKII